MKHIKKFNESIFTSKYDDILKSVFNKIKSEFNLDNLNGSEYSIIYKLNNGDIVSAQDDTFFAIPGYSIEINKEDIDGSFILCRSIFKFLQKKRNEKYKDSDKLKKETDKLYNNIERNKRSRMEDEKINKLKDKYLN